MCAVIVGVYYVSAQHIAHQQRLQITREDTPVVQRNHTSALEDVLKKISDGLGEARTKPVAAPPSTSKQIDDNETIDQVLQRYIQKAQEQVDEDEHDGDASDVRDNDIDIDNDNDVEIEDKMLSVSGNVPEPRVVTLEDLAIDE